LRAFIIQRLSKGICYIKNNPKENNEDGSIKEKSDKRSDKMISGFAGLNDPSDRTF
jgi:hypothetical protein